MQAQQVGSRSDQRYQRHHQLFPDGVDGRIGDLSEILLEVVEQRLGLVGQHRQGVVRTHGADTFLAGEGHGGEQEFQVFLGVAEGLLAVQQRGGVRGHGAHLGRQLRQPDLGLVQPLLVGPGGGQLGFELGIVNDAALLHVDEQHAARLQAPLLHHLLVGDVQYAHFRGHHHQIVVGDQVAGRAQAVAVQGGADLAAVREGHRRRSVPGLHQRGVVLVECPALVVHQRIAGPRLWDQHHHGMGQRIAAGHQQFQGVVEAGRVRLAFGDQRPEFGQIVAQQLRGHGMMAGPHPVDVAPQGVDLTVVGQEPERLGQIPGREGIGGKALMHQRQGADHARIAQVGVVAVHLIGQQHALVDHGAAGQGVDVEGLAAFQAGLRDGVFHAPADDEQLALEGVLIRTAGAAGDEQLAHRRLHDLHAVAQAVVVGGDVAPAQQHLALFGDQAFDQLLATCPAGLGLGQKHHAHPVNAGLGQGHTQGSALLAQESVGNLQQHAGSVAGQGIGAHGTPMGQIF